MEYLSGEAVPESGAYEELNAFGSVAGRVACLNIGDTFPATARGCTWRPLPARSPAEYRRLADASYAERGAAHLRQIADALDALAALDALCGQEQRDGAGG